MQVYYMKKDVVLDEKMKKSIISKEDFKKYFCADYRDCGSQYDFLKKRGAPPSLTVRRRTDPRIQNTVQESR